jgi:hypothetical protein
MLEDDAKFYELKNDINSLKEEVIVLNRNYAHYQDVVSNLKNLMLDIEKRFIDYVEKNPKGDDQWTEARLRALEEKCLKKG